jgi:hypothetical protein
MGFHVAHWNDKWKFLLKYETFFGGSIKETMLYQYDEIKGSGIRRNFPPIINPNLWVYKNKHLFLYKNDLVVCTDTTCYVTNDGAENWKDIPNLLVGIKRSYRSQDSFLFASAINQKAFYISSDWGQNWVQFNNYIPAHANAFAISGNQAYWFTNTGFFTADATDLLKLLNKIKVNSKNLTTPTERQPYPNPVLAGQEIRLPGNTPIRSCRIYALTGQLLHQFQNVDHWSIPTPGYYLLEWEDADWQKGQSKIIVTTAL